MALPRALLRCPTGSRRLQLYLLLLPALLLPCFLLTLTLQAPVLPAALTRPLPALPPLACGTARPRSATSPARPQWRPGLLLDFQACVFHESGFGDEIRHFLLALQHLNCGVRIHCTDICKDRSVFTEKPSDELQQLLDSCSKGGDEFSRYNQLRDVTAAAIAEADKARDALAHTLSRWKVASRQARAAELQIAAEAAAAEFAAFAPALGPTERRIVLAESWAGAGGALPAPASSCRGDYFIFRTMFETEQLQPEWVPGLLLFEELWLPSQHNIDAFVRSGVPRDMIHLMPGTTDTAAIDRRRALPNAARDLRRLTNRRFNFVSIFEWGPRKGYAELIHAFLDEFGDGTSSSDDVGLVIKTSVNRTQAASDLGLDALPGHIVFINEYLNADALIDLLAGADAFALATHGEGWCRPAMEAMLLEKLVVITNHSGQLEFCNEDNSLLVANDIGPSRQKPPSIYAGLDWAWPRPAHLRQQLRAAVAMSATERAAYGRRARRDILAKFSPEVVATAMVRRLNDIYDQLVIGEPAHRTVVGGGAQSTIP